MCEYLYSSSSSSSSRVVVVLVRVMKTPLAAAVLSAAVTLYVCIAQRVVVCLVYY